MPIELHCPGCNRLLRLVEAPRAGQKVRCPGCGQLALVQDDRDAAAAGPTMHVLDSDAEVPQGPTVAETFTPPAASVPEQPVQQLGGYALLKELGRGGMGTVYLARQLSLDRLVAVKVMDPRKARQPAFLARFTREAYAAAQLVHHNIVPIYDVGADQDVHFYSMEYVKGESLFDLVARGGALDPEVAVGYLLQAARGLKYGHDMGMVHRDVKPENLLLNEHGIVKVADLGLVKIPYAEEIVEHDSAHAPSAREESRAQGLSQVTRVGSAVGTPTYMAPEQARDAAGVDARADIYSLGCTLYVLVTGKPPFEGRTAIELISKHQSEPIVLPAAVVKRAPKALFTILAKMLAKKPEERYADMGAVIADFEKFLGIQEAGPFTPRAEDIAALEKCVKEFDDTPYLKLRRRALWGFVDGCGLVFALSVLLGWLRLAGGILGLAALTPLMYAAIRGWREKSYLFTKVRAWIFDSSWRELAYGGVAGLLFGLILYVLGLFWLWVIMAVVGASLAVTCYILIDRPLRMHRNGPLQRTAKLLRAMRLKGLDEVKVRLFVCKYAGRNWEEFYEALFGYEAKRKARNWLRGETARRRHKFAAWREPLIAWIDAQQQKRKELRERELLQAVEAKALEAEGVNAADAQEKAAERADAMVQQAAQIKEETAAASEDGAPVRPALRELVETAQYTELPPTAVSQPARPGRAAAFLRSMLLGPFLRFVAGACLLLGCALWIQQNQAVEGRGLLTEIRNAVSEGDWQKLDPLGEVLDLPFLPAGLSELFHSFRPGIAGLILILSTLARGWKAAVIGWLAALVMVLGAAIGMPAVGPVTAELASLVLGLAVAVGGVLIFARKKPVAEADGKDDPIVWTKN